MPILSLHEKWFTNFLYSHVAKEEMKKKSKHPQDNRLSRREFRQFVIMVCDNMPGADAFEYFVEFLNNSVEVSSLAWIIELWTRGHFNHK